MLTHYFEILHHPFKILSENTEKDFHYLAIISHYFEKASHLKVFFPITLVEMGIMPASGQVTRFRTKR